ncbi:MAG: hypothetical protein EBU93_06035 [Chlamydiae bacterium]|nr:hypothetical protein [Chlamydiota bacterium]
MANDQVSNLAADVKEKATSEATSALKDSAVTIPPIPDTDALKKEGSSILQDQIDNLKNMVKENLITPAIDKIKEEIDEKIGCME